MKVYLAAPWVDKQQAQEVADILVRQGHCITTRWWEHRDVPGYRTGNETRDEMAELAEQAQLDLDGVLSADVFVLMNSTVSEGKAVETGVAICSGVPVIILGKRSNLFHYCDMVELVDDIDQLLMCLDSMELTFAGAGYPKDDDDFDGDEDENGGW